jgi:hypothetical protein
MLLLMCVCGVFFFSHKTQKFWTSLGKCLKFEGYLMESAVQGGFGSTISLSQKAQKWIREAGRNKDEPSLKLVPSQDLLLELRATAVKEAIRHNARYSNSQACLKSL